MSKAIKHQNIAYEQSKKPTNSKKNRVLFVLITVLVVLFLSALIIQQFLPIDEPPIQTNSWNGLTPGYSLTSKLTAELGDPVRVTRLPAEKQRVSYQSQSFTAYTNDVIVNNRGVVEFITIPVAYEETNILANYTSLYGEPDSVLYASHISPTLKAHTFLEEGLTIIANEDTGVIEEMWYFVPTDLKSFRATWGNELSEVQFYQERFVE